MNRVQLWILDKTPANWQSISDLKKLCAFLPLRHIIKMERTQDKQVINITEPLMNQSTN
jgi:hypothetical protein